MSQTQSDLGQTQTRPATPTGGAGAAVVDDDPLSHLHKMSTTAGLGSGEYVAVNGAAVFALILGLFSAAALFETVLLAIPVAAIVVAIMAWRQIAQSNGTQTGKGLVALALLLALGFGGFVVGNETTRGLRTREDRTIIARTIKEFGEKIKANDMTGAYTMFSEQFHQSVDLERFTRQMNFVREGEIYGKLKDTEWNGLADFHTDDASGQRFAFTKLKMNLDKAQFEVEATLRKDGQRWVFQSMPTFFQAQQPQQGQGQRQGQGQPGRQ